jgi:hypothetical protein
MVIPEDIETVAQKPGKRAVQKEVGMIVKGAIFAFMNRLRTDFLFARPSFLSGFARVLDLFGLFDSYNDSPSPLSADGRAIYADWRVVGLDIQEAAGQFEAEIQAEKSKQLTLNIPAV